MLTCICEHGVEDAVKLGRIAQQPVSLKVRDDQDDNGSVQQPANNIDGEELRGLCMNWLAARLFKRPAPVPEEAVQHRQKKCKR